MKRLHTLLLTSFLLLPAVSNANYSKRPDVKEFIADMVSQHGFDEQQLSLWMQDVQQQKSALEAIARPAEAKPWKDYRPIFITSKRINRGVEFWATHAETLQRAEQKYGVPAEIIVAIIGVETFYGKRAGNYPVLDALTTLGFDYPLENTTQERRDRRERFFRKELKEYLLMTREEKVDPRTLKGSYAGAMGMPQFISSSFRAYAIDFDGDGKRDLWNSTADAIGSVANYFSRHGWKGGQPIVSRASVAKPADGLGSKNMRPHKAIGDYKQLGVTPVKAFNDSQMATLLKLEGSRGNEYWLGLENFYVITRYNHSPLYAMAVYQLGQAVASKYRSRD
ncbi:MAG: lytic murein transglycosylase B [Gammaproteobacteria bacterium]|nr:lytic murein transglycosylase B [Gammaproteobacteria bacterium]